MNAWNARDMAERDRVWLKTAGLTMTEAANYLGGISRQAVAKQIALDKIFFTEERLYAICGSLAKLGRPRDLRVVESLLQSAKVAGISMEVRGIGSPLSTLRMMTPLGSKEFWLFSDKPRDLQRGPFLNFLAESVFSENVLAVYFVPTESVGTSLRKAINQAETEILTPRKKAFVANVYIIETDLATLLPHIIIRAPQSLCVQNEDADLQSGWVLAGSSTSGDQMVELPRDYTQKLIELVRDADIGVNLKLTSFFPPKTNMVRARGVYFKLLWKKIAN